MHYTKQAAAVCAGVAASRRARQLHGAGHPRTAQAGSAGAQAVAAQLAAPVGGRGPPATKPGTSTPPRPTAQAMAQAQRAQQAARSVAIQARHAAWHAAIASAGACACGGTCASGSCAYENAAALPNPPTTGASGFPVVPSSRPGAGAGSTGCYPVFRNESAFFVTVVWLDNARTKEETMLELRPGEVRPDPRRPGGRLAWPGVSCFRGAPRQSLRLSVFPWFGLKSRVCDAP